MGAVASVDDGYRCNLTGILGRSFNEVAHGNDIGIIAHHQDGVFQCLTFCATGNLGIGKTDYSCTKTVGGCLVTQTGTGGGFKE